jgi:hypothetical protein
MQDRKLARRAVLPNHRKRIAGISEAIARLQEEGQVARTVDAEALAEMVTGLTNYLGLMAPALYGMTRKRLRELAKDAARVMASGIRPNEPSRRGSFASPSPGAASNGRSKPRSDIPKSPG